ncbi:hypothetical protein BaRGS_00000956, partial [Batillaria attramentaria]
AELEDNTRYHGVDIYRSGQSNPHKSVSIRYNDKDHPNRTAHLRSQLGPISSITLLASTAPVHAASNRQEECETFQVSFALPP